MDEDRYLVTNEARLTTAECSCHGKRTLVNFGHGYAVLMEPDLCLMLRNFLCLMYGMPTLEEIERDDVRYSDGHGREGKE